VAQEKRDLVHIASLLFALATRSPRVLHPLLHHRHPIPIVAMAGELLEQKRPGKYLAVTVNEIE